MGQKNEVLRACRFLGGGLMCYLALFGLLMPDGAWANRTVRVGLYQNPPLFFSDEQGVPQGFYVDLLRHIAGQENWRLEYASGTWQQCMDRLAAGEIDMLPAIAFTQPRREIYDFTRQNVLANWAQVYAQPNTDMVSFLDLSGKTVALLKGDIYADAVYRKVAQFGLTCDFVEKDSFSDVLRAVQTGEADAGVVSRSFGLASSLAESVQKTPIVFEPTELRFGLPKGQNADLAQTIDRHMIALKADMQSPYYAALNRWIVNDPVTSSVWVWWISIGGIGLSGVLLFLVWMHRRRAQKARMQLEMAEESHEKALSFHLVESHNQLVGLINHLPEGVCLIDGKGHIEVINPRMRDYMSLLADGKDVGDTISRIGDYTLHEMLASPEGVNIREIQKGEKVFEAAVNFIAPAHPEQGLVITCRDVTAMHQMRMRSEQQSRLAAVGQLAAGIAHDFNNLLTVMMGTAQLADLQSDLPENIREDLKNIYRQGRRASHLIQQVLDFSRKTVTEKTPLDLMPFLKETVKLLERTLPEIQIRLVANADTAVVRANLVQLQQVIANLAVNARDAMPDGGVLSIEVDRVYVDAEHLPLPDMKPGAYVRWMVHDTGTGMPPGVLKHCFEPFFSTKAPGKGTGLGLSQVIGIVEQHQGKICVESEMGKGTCFCIYLPEAEQVEVQAERTDPDAVKGDGELLLLVEDDAGVQMVARKFLESLKYRVITAGHGQEALDVLKTREDVALILSDVVMPEMGGQALVKALRDTGRKIPVILMSGYPLRESGDAFAPLHIAGWLPKPLDLRALASMVKKALSG